MSYHLIDLVQGLGTPRILVLGDLILDRYLWGNAERISQEAPVILLREEQQEIRLGGAANVANMLRGLSARVTMAGVVGNDRDGEDILQALAARGVDCSGILVDHTRPTTVKQRLIGHAQHRHPHQMLRIDRESREPLESLYATQLLDRVVSQISQHDAILISDYAKGVCTPEVLRRVIDVARDAGVPTLVDPAPTDDYRHYAGATAMTPNRTETGKATGMTLRTYDEAFAAGAKLVRQLGLERIFVTLDKDGIAVVRGDGSHEAFPTRQREVYDITGAGDMVLATIGLGAAARWEDADLARMANISGGLEVEQVGVVCLTREELVADLLHERSLNDQKLCPLPIVQRHLQSRKNLGQKVVFTNGCFDVLHIGHVSYLKQAAALGDCLVVAINTDDSVRRLGKAPDRPIFPEAQRAEMLAALECVDYVVLFDEDTPHNVLETLQPDVLVKGGTYTPEQIVGREVVLGYGGEVHALGERPGISTTNILARLRGEATILPLTKASDPVVRKAG
ncbi:MAG: D-glycero-beta-D-manno-heptose 1-phosphate adenylyltransferase [Planctomycetaceae bacterium]|nr:D-glycero-beta-D-manno-heptose 1-phosphate adenylyltransferase [Planctomycetaceae bacterium]